MGMRIKAASSLTFVLLVAFVFELLAVLTVPVTKSLALCTYGDYQYGVFGYCNKSTGECSSVAVGYDMPTDNTGFKLPSSAKRSLSNLLIVHVVACGLCFVLTILAALAHIHGPGSSQRYLLALLAFAMPTFVLSLLAFLVDILLFVNHLDWIGWTMLAATILVALSFVILCVMRRMLSSNKAMKRRNANEPMMTQPFGGDVFGPTDSAAHLNKGGPDFPELKYETNDWHRTDETVPLHHQMSRDDHNAGAGVGDMSYASVGNDSTDPLNPSGGAAMGAAAAGAGSQSPSRDYYRGVQMYPSASGGGNRDDTQTPASRKSRKQRDQHIATVPAGTYLPDAEDDAASTFGPGVVPIPKIRNQPGSAPVRTPTAGSAIAGSALALGEPAATGYDGGQSYGSGSYDQRDYQQDAQQDYQQGDAYAQPAGSYGYENPAYSSAPEGYAGSSDQYDSGADAGVEGAVAGAAVGAAGAAGAYNYSKRQQHHHHHHQQQQQPQQPQQHTVPEYNEYGASYDAPPVPPAHGQAVSASTPERPGPNRQPSDSPDVYVAPRQRWQRENRNPVEDMQRGQPVTRMSPAQSQRRQYVDRMPAPQSAEHYYDNGHQYNQAPPPQPSYYDYQPHNAGSYGERLPSKPSSPAASDSSSHYTSISQRGPNLQAPPQPAPAPAPQPPQQTRSEFALQNNPDFSVGAPSKRRNQAPAGAPAPMPHHQQLPQQQRANRNKARPPAASEVSDSPFAISRAMH